MTCGAPARISTSTWRDDVAFKTDTVTRFWTRRKVSNLRASRARVDRGDGLRASAKALKLPHLEEEPRRHFLRAQPAVAHRVEQQHGVFRRVVETVGHSVADGAGATRAFAKFSPRGGATSATRTRRRVRVPRRARVDPAPRDAGSPSPWPPRPRAETPRAWTGAPVSDFTKAASSATSARPKTETRRRGRARRPNVRNPRRSMIHAPNAFGLQAPRRARRDQPIWLAIPWRMSTCPAPTPG
jgi:hypothetical protein